MNVLITGATGYIGSAVAGALVEAGHVVHGLARTDDASTQIQRRGWLPVRGDLQHADHLRLLAKSFDATIHTANAGGEDAAAIDRAATMALLDGLAGSGKPFIYTSGAWVLGAGDSDEQSPVDPPSLVAWRATLEKEVVEAAPGVRTVVIRPGIAYGRRGGILRMMATGDLPIIGDGTQRWPLVHVDHLADLYVRALIAPAGAVLHGVSHTCAMLDLALCAFAGRSDPRRRALPIPAARALLGPLADALALDQRVSSRGTRRLVGWHPVARSPVEELLRRPPAKSGRAYPEALNQENDSRSPATNTTR